MKDIQTSMRLSLIFGLVGAVFLPVIYELYANVSRPFAIFLILVYSITAGFVMSSLKTGSALLGITVCIIYNAFFGMLAYIIIHPAVQHFLNSHSQYFQLSLSEYAGFLLYTALILLCMYLVCFVRKCVGMAYSKFKANSDKTGSYIENAFSDGSDVK